jgi:PAS domain-containing protein
MRFFSLILCLCLASCASQADRVTFSAGDVRGAVAAACGKTPQLWDMVYGSVSLHEIVMADQAAWRPWVPVSWDCDDQAASLTHRLRQQRYLSQVPPACGSAMSHRHAFVWWLDDGGRVRFWDPSARAVVDQPPTKFQWVSDK